MFKYWWLIGSILCFLFYRASFERFVKKHGWFLFPEILLSIRSFFFQNICFSYVDKKEMGNWDAIKVCVNVEIKFWFIQKRLLLDHTGSEMKSFVFKFRQLLIVIQKSSQSQYYQVITKLLFEPKFHFNFCAYLKSGSSWFGYQLPLFENL